jgi:hypothetical protein
MTDRHPPRPTRKDVAAEKAAHECAALGQPSPT